MWTTEIRRSPNGGVPPTALRSRRREALTRGPYPWPPGDHVEPLANPTRRKLGVPEMTKTFRMLLGALALSLALAVPAYAAPPQSPSATGECAAETAQDRMGKPEDPSISFPFECPPPPPFRGEAP